MVAFYALSTSSSAVPIVSIGSASDCSILGFAVAGAEVLNPYGPYFFSWQEGTDPLHTSV